MHDEESPCTFVFNAREVETLCFVERDMLTVSSHQGGTLGAQGEDRHTVCEALYQSEQTEQQPHIATPQTEQRHCQCIYRTDTQQRGTRGVPALCVCYNA